MSLNIPFIDNLSISWAYFLVINLTCCSSCSFCLFSFANLDLFALRMANFIKDSVSKSPVFSVASFRGIAVVLVVETVVVVVVDIVVVVVVVVIVVVDGVKVAAFIALRIANFSKDSKSLVVSVAFLMGIVVVLVVEAVVVVLVDIDVVVGVEVVVDVFVVVVDGVKAAVVVAAFILKECEFLSMSLSLDSPSKKLQWPCWQAQP